MPPPPGPGSPVVPGDLRAVLERHQSAVAGLRAGLADLEVSPSYLMLTGSGVGPVTASRLGSTTVSTEELWATLQAASGALDEVATHIDTNGLRGRHRERAADLLSQRWVGDPGGPHRSIGELVDAARTGYDQLRPLVAEIDQLWLAVLPRLDAAKASLARLEAEVTGLGVPEPLVGRARAVAQDLEQRLVGDPLSVSLSDGDELDAQVAAAARQVSSMLAGRAALDADVGQTEQLLAELRVLRARAAAARTQAETKLVDPGDLVRVPSTEVFDGPGGLAGQLDQILGLGSDTPWNHRRGLLDTWLTTVERLSGQLQRALEANTAPLDRRRELRGRLRAYQAKVSAVGRAEDLDLTALVDQARAELYTAPTDLGRATTIIDELARSLRS